VNSSTRQLLGISQSRGMIHDGMTDMSYDSAAGTTVNCTSTSPDWGLKTVLCLSVHRCPHSLASTITGVDKRWTACLLCLSQCSGCPGVGADWRPDVTVWLEFSRHSIHIATPLHSAPLHTANIYHNSQIYRHFQAPSKDQSSLWKCTVRLIKQLLLVKL